MAMLIQSLLIAKEFSSNNLMHLLTSKNGTTVLFVRFHKYIIYLRKIGYNWTILYDFFGMPFFRTQMRVNY